MQEKNSIKLMTSIAFTQLKAKKTQTIVATIGVAFGIAVFIFLLSCVKGINQYLTELSLEQYPDVRLFNEVRITELNLLDRQHPDDNNILHHAKPKHSLLYLKDSPKAIREIAENPMVKAVSGTVKVQVFYHVGTSGINGEITGINYESENQLLNISDKFIEGNAAGLRSIPNSLVMGKSLADRLNMKTGDRIVITTSNGTDLTATLSGIIKTGIPEKDKELCYATLKTVQNLLKVPPSYITDIHIKLHDRSTASEYATGLEKTYGYKGSDWLRDNPFLFEGDKLNDIIFKCIAASILLVAGFGIFNILNMMIYEKMKDISIIKAMGFSDRDVRSIFMIQSLSIGVAGALLGLLVGYIISWVMTLVPYRSDFFVSLEGLPMCFDISYYIFGLLFGVLTTAFAGYLPSRKAARLDPISILRG